MFANITNRSASDEVPAPVIPPVSSSSYSGNSNQWVILSMWRHGAQERGFLGSCDVTQMGDKRALLGKEMKNHQICGVEGMR